MIWYLQSLTDNLNAEVSLGTVTNVDEAVKWLSYTYLFVRMKANPLVYGIPYTAVQVNCARAGMKGTSEHNYSKH